MYKILNYLFGWDYVAWQNTCAHGIARVQVNGDGEPFIFYYKITNAWKSLKNPGHFNINWLTCSPKKYGV